MDKFSPFLLLSLLFLLACQGEAVEEKAEPSSEEKTDSAVSLAPAEDTAFLYAEARRLRQLEIRDSLLSLEDSAWVDLQQLIPQADYEIRYATTNNFMELQVYACPGCYTRLAVAKSLMAVQQNLDSMGLSLKFFDCYRPSSAQWALWKKTPDPRYVHPPKQGSMHSRGNALDLSLVDSLGQELDMGTPFDYFGKEAYWSYTQHSEEVNKNRKLLRQQMQAAGFSTIRTEWWHFVYKAQRFPLSNWQWSCPTDSLKQKG